MLDYAISIIAPHVCKGCGTTYNILCANCIDVILDTEFMCFCCGKPTFQSWLCDLCQQKCPYDNAWAVGKYDGALKGAIYSYKFERARAANKVFAGTLNARVPVLPAETVVTSVPTASGRIRQRGYDQTELLAKRFAKMRQLPYAKLLKRINQSKQLGADKKTRKEQADVTYACRFVVPKTVIVIDDVCTTSATLTAITRKLKQSGASAVYVATLAYEPLHGKIS